MEDALSEFDWAPPGSAACHSPRTTQALDIVRKKSINQRLIYN